MTRFAAARAARRGRRERAGGASALAASSAPSSSSSLTCTAAASGLSSPGAWPPAPPSSSRSASRRSSRTCLLPDTASSLSLQMALSCATVSLARRPSAAASRQFAGSTAGCFWRLAAGALPARPPAAARVVAALRFLSSLATRSTSSSLSGPPPKASRKAWMARAGLPSAIASSCGSVSSSSSGSHSIGAPLWPALRSATLSRQA
mmetsp:Transcript_5274/g.16930  ORF Transcript_5274/g.16930 Transcript_5274/m.16930 type:complete len:206 (-) Transcript_5274:1382-1999(-)